MKGIKMKSFPILCQICGENSVEFLVEWVVPEAKGLRLEHAKVLTHTRKRISVCDHCNTTVDFDKYFGGS
jgi:hypothetical protein